MVQRSLSHQPQPEPPSPPENGNPPTPAPDGVWLTDAEWAEATDIDMAFYAALRCDVDEPHQLELIKSVQVRYSRFVKRIEDRLHGDPEE